LYYSPLQALAVYAMRLHSFLGNALVFQPFIPQDSYIFFYDNHLVQSPFLFMFVKAIFLGGSYLLTSFSPYHFYYF
jgi:hypothetical protein